MTSVVRLGVVALLALSAACVTPVRLGSGPRFTGSVVFMRGHRVASLQAGSDEVAFEDISTPFVSAVADLAIDRSGGRVAVAVSHGTAREPGALLVSGEDCLALIAEGGFVDVDWSADGERLLATGFETTAGTAAFGLYLYSDHLRQLIAGDVTSAAWHPDGEKIVIAVDGDIVVTNAAGEGRNVVVGGAATDSDPTWSPDGAAIAFVRHTENTDASIWTVGADGSRMRPVGSANLTGAITWAEEGIVASVDRGLLLVDVSSGHATQILEPEDDGFTVDHAPNVVSGTLLPDLVYDDDCDAS